MARPAYLITERDLVAAKNWLAEKNRQFKLFQMDGSGEAEYLARRALDEAMQACTNAYIRNDEGRGEALQGAIAQLNTAIEPLTPMLRKQMHAAVRANRVRSRRRLGDKRVGIQLTSRAHHILAGIAEAEGVTLSDVIEKHLEQRYHAIIDA
ncbi:MAG: hypothetical protein M0037_01560 [Betaproteobacteria bacterium]|nr:hypothetical protein [Betaproteobacteria bacterium]